MSFFLQDVFWALHISIVRMDNFQFLAQFPMNYLPNQVMSSIILFLKYFAAFFHYVIDPFLCITT